MSHYDLTGGFMAGAPGNLSRSSIITEEDLEYFVQTFSKTGFRYFQFRILIEGKNNKV